jgi:hypothetical protein
MCKKFKVWFNKKSHESDIESLHYWERRLRRAEANLDYCKDAVAAYKKIVERGE